MSLKKESYIEKRLKKKINTPKNKIWSNIRYISLIALFAFIQFTLATMSNNKEFTTLTLNNISISRSSIVGIFAQLFNIVSIKLVLDFMKKGYITALILNVIASFMATRGFLIAGNIDSAPGIIIPIIGCFIVSIIYHYYQKANTKYEDEARKSKS